MAKKKKVEIEESVEEIVINQSEPEIKEEYKIEEDCSGTVKGY